MGITILGSGFWLAKHRVGDRAKTRMARALSGLIAVLGRVGLQAQAHADVFDSVHYLEPDEYAIGIEPQFIFSNGAGVGTNVQFTHGVNELSNYSLILGTGAGAEQFRTGGNYSFDFFPDVKNQPGIGVLAQAMYYRMGSYGELDVTAAPYVHKSFVSNGTEFDPFIAVPLGWGLTQGNLMGVDSVAVGSIFKASAHLSYVTELGVAINHSNSYFSGGIVYSH